MTYRVTVNVTLKEIPLDVFDFQMLFCILQPYNVNRDFIHFVTVVVL